jgi:hypothetical protein
MPPTGIHRLEPQGIHGLTRTGVVAAIPAFS